MWVWTLLIFISSLEVASADEPPKATYVQCVRSASRDAARIIEHTITPVVQSKGYTLPPGCPLNASLSIFGRQEAHKKLVRKGVWQCEFDKKIFRSEAFIDKHMDNKHAHEVTSDAAVCLGSLCEALHCSFFLAFEHDALSSLAHTPCHPPTMERIKLECQDLAHKCFPLHLGQSAEELHAFFINHFCAASQCSWRLREKLLKPLAQDKHGQTVLWMMFIWGVIALLALSYGLLLCHWSSRVHSNSWLQALGFKKWKAEKLY